MWRGVEVRCMRSLQSTHYVNVLKQAQRLFQLLFSLFQIHKYFVDIYYQTIHKCLENNNSNNSNNDMFNAALQQIASHLSQINNYYGNDKERQQQRQKLLEIAKHTIDKYNNGSSVLPSSIREILTTIESFLKQSATDKDKNNNASILKSLNLLYPFTSRWLEVHREFRDCTQYFIDGDSLLLTVSHYSNVNLNEYYGHTLHVIHIIERILLTLFNQSNETNYYILFFDDLKNKLSNSNNSILYLLRQCLIEHIQSNMRSSTTKLRLFTSFLSEEYTTFYTEEKPLFIFYTDITSSFSNSLLLTKNEIEQLTIYYRYFVNYHQYYIKCGLYLTNKMKLADTSVQCFRISYEKAMFNYAYKKATCNVENTR
ncbi:unnamed protein product [Didymodactylos carnosus]|uniref:Uncharacterized protein n=1 Tax=Didymodactylos carnosus TaxID=1234261 RepID=A0A814VQL5_9BILA|nr:unnamed protein product [Didymodactylos carnosus]CAF1400292.1 unnamed protein product [Didymodactylos carnosus]CAF3955844.1 unnamed protein product [Didymodactylos carnosus]CAF4207701.1 unnamed protein product [Didymodactylos carnosus]